MKRHLVVALGSLTMISACATVEVGGSPVHLAPELAANARVGQIYVSTDWLDSEEDFQATFTDALAGEMALCGGGSHRLNLSVHIEALRRAPRGQILAGDDARHRLKATAEFKDPSNGGQVVGRYPIVVDIPAGSGAVAALMDRQDMVSNAFARTLCEQAFHEPS